MPVLKIFLSTFVFCFIVDLIWLGFIAKSMYHNALGHLLRMSNGTLDPNWIAAFLVYVAIVSGVVFFALPKADGNYLMGIFWGGMLGLIIYGVYDFTNLSILANWPVSISIIDVIWGGVLCALTTCFAVFMQQWLAS